jgi:lysozyme
LRVALVVFLAAALVGCGGKPPPSSGWSAASAPTASVQAARATPTVSRAITDAPRFGDSKPHEWQDRAPWRYPVHGIDVSKWQGTIDWHEVRRSGVDFAFIKATEGGDHLDERFAENWIGAGRAGVRRGAYHFYYFCRPASEQARWFIAHVPREAGAMPPVLDMEWNHLSRTCRTRPGAEAIRAEMRVWKETVGAHYRRRPIIYTTVDFYRDNELWRVEGYEFWLRSVAGHPQTVYPGQNWTFWQYTGTGHVPGVTGNTDINVFAGSETSWASWLATRLQ